MKKVFFNFVYLHCLKFYKLNSYMNSRKIFYIASYCIFILVITLILISCSKENKIGDTSNKKESKDTSKKTTTTQTGSGTAAAGKEFFYMKSSVNNIACSDCHTDGTNASNPLTKYFSTIQGANKRTSTYNGKFTGEEVVKSAGGATICWETYLRMKNPMTEEQIKNLNDFYESVAAPNSPTEIKYESIALPTKDRSKLKEIQKVVMGLKGDPGKGEQTFNNACGLCHSENATVKKVPSILEDFEGNVKSITFNVRLGDGAMPFFKTESLTDQDIADVSAYILQKSGK